MISLLNAVARVVVWIFLVCFCIWSVGALWFDFPFFPKVVALLFPLLLVGCLFWSQSGRQKLFVVFFSCLAVMLWWFSLRPSHDRDWQTPVSRLPYARIQDGEVTVYDVRDFSFSETGDYAPRWITKKFRLEEIEALDILINYWGSRWIAHPILSFQIRGQEPLCFSIETRREQGEEYSALGGFFRRYELIVLAATERDLLGIRINPSAAEELFLYRTSANPPVVRERFLEMVDLMNTIKENPRWYNAITTNCTTALRTGAGFRERIPMDWRLLINGFGDEMLFDLGVFRSGGLEFPALREQARISQDAWIEIQEDGFSSRIRAGRAGFSPE